MAIGTAAAIGLGVAGVGSFLGASSANKASKRAANVAQETADQNKALTREIYGQNRDMLSPFVNTGTAAMGNINALLGIAPQGGPTTGGIAPQGGNWGAYLAANPDVAREYSDDNDERSTFATPEAYAQWHYQNYGQREGRQLPGVAAGGQPIGQPAVTQPSAQQAFDTYRNSTGYQFRLGEGMNALNSGYAGNGALKSGAAMKAAVQYGQNLASSEFGNYLNALGNQQGLGLSGASALAGVGQNFTNTISANNNSAGTAAANAALAKQNPLANTLGLIGGGMFGFGR